MKKQQNITIADSLIKFFSKTKIDSLGEYANILVCLSFYENLSCLSWEDYKEEKVDFLLRNLNKEFAFLEKIRHKKDLALDENGKVYITLAKWENFAREMENELQLVKENKSAYWNIVRKAQKFCLENEEMYLEYQEEKHKYNKAKKGFIIVILVLLFDMAILSMTFFSLLDYIVEYDNDPIQGKIEEDITFCTSSLEEIDLERILARKL